MIPANQVVGHTAGVAGVQQFLHRPRLVALLHAAFQLVAAGAEAGPSEKVGHQGDVFVAHFRPLTQGFLRPHEKTGLNSVLGVGSIPILCFGRRRLCEPLAVGFGVQPALVPSHPPLPFSSHSSLNPFPSVIFVKECEYHNYVHHHNAIGRDYGDAPSFIPERGVPSYGEYGLRPRISGSDEHPYCISAGQTANPTKAAVWREKIAKNNFRHLSGTLQTETRRSGSGVDITSQPS